MIDFQTAASDGGRFSLQKNQSRTGELFHRL
jgi:hypothetical protein